MEPAMKMLVALAFAIGLAAAAPTLAWSAPAHILLESRVDAGSGAEVFHIDYASLADVKANNFSGTGFTPMDINSAFRMADYAYDHGTYRILLESRADAAGGAEVALVNFNSFADLETNHFSSSLFLPVNINPDFSIMGFTYDGAYRLLLESDADAGSGAEVAEITYNTYADLLANNFSASGFTPINIAADFRGAGLGFDGSAYHLLLESRADAGSGAEVAMTDFDSWNDVLTNHFSGSGFTPINFDSHFESRGFDFDVPSVCCGAVPEPTTWLMTLLGFFGLGAASRRRRARALAR
jgi:hypothetical protein